DVARVPGGRLFTSVLIFAGLGTALYFASALTTFLIEGEFQHLRTRRKMKKTIGQLSGHIIVCGVGAHGAAGVAELCAPRWPVVAVDKVPEKTDRMKERLGTDVPSLLGDATEDEVLLEAGISRAQGLITTLPEDRDNLFVVITARQLAPRLKIVA